MYLTYLKGIHNTNVLSNLILNFPEIPDLYKDKEVELTRKPVTVIEDEVEAEIGSDLEVRHLPFAPTILKP